MRHMYVHCTMYLYCLPFIDLWLPNWLLKSATLTGTQKHFHFASFLLDRKQDVQSIHQQGQIRCPVFFLPQMRPKWKRCLSFYASSLRDRLPVFERVPSSAQFPQPVEKSSR